MIWWIFPAAVGLFGLIVTLTGLAHMTKMKFATGTARLMGGGLFIAGAVVLSLIGVNLQTYSRLTLERSVAIVDLTMVEPQVYQANVRFTNDDEVRTYEIRGDEIQFQARVIKWNQWAHIIGYDSIYRMDRVQGRYTSVDEEIKKPRTVYSAPEEPGIDAYTLIKKRGGWLKAVDASYGSGTYIPMANGASFEIIMTQSGLISRPINDAARQVQKSWTMPTSQNEAEHLVGIE